MPKKQASGGARLKAAGKVAVLLGLWPDDAKILKAAAESEDIPLTQFIVREALAAAQKKKTRKSSN